MEKWQGQHDKLVEKFAEKQKKWRDREKKYIEKLSFLNSIVGENDNLQDNLDASYDINLGGAAKQTM